jgi:hypothetical protein
VADANPPPTGRFFWTADVTQRVVDVLAPYLGANMAKTSVALQLKKIAPSDELLTPAQVDQLIDKLRPGLAVFIGGARADEAVASMKRAVGEPGQ